MCGSEPCSSGEVSNKVAVCCVYAVWISVVCDLVLLTVTFVLLKVTYLPACVFWEGC
jgi:hypothetical protein